MNWDEIKGSWKQFSGKVREQWGRFTDDDLDVIGGRRDQLIGQIQYRYGTTRDAAEKQVSEFERRFNAAAGR